MPSRQSSSGTPPHLPQEGLQEGRMQIGEQKDDSLSSTQQNLSTRANAVITGNTEELIDLPTDRIVLNQQIEFCREGKRISMDRQNEAHVIRVNVSRFPTAEDAERAANVQASYVNALQRHLQSDTNRTLEALKEQDRAAHAALRLKGVQTLSEWEPTELEKLKRIAETPHTLTQLFDQACEQYILTGSFPDNIPEEVTEALKSIPRRGDKSALDYVAQGNRSLASSAKLFSNHIEPLRKALRRSEGEKRTTERDDYTPPNFQGETEPLDLESVRWKVEPFVGGYYRQQLFRYDPNAQRIIAEPTEKNEFRLNELPDDIDELQRYTFRGMFVPGEENRIPFPEHGLPLPETLDPKEKFLLMRSSAGIFSLEPCLQDVNLTQPVPYSFEFVLVSTKDNAIDDEPTENDLVTIDGTLDEQADTLVTQIKGNAFLDANDRARGVVLGTKKQFRYPKDEERSGMDEQYCSAGGALHTEMAALGVADCHWSNIRASDLGRRLDVPMRTPAGYFVTKHPDCDFAPIGGIGHAWSERWDEKKSAWVRMDATPPQENDEENERDENERAEGPGGEPEESSGSEEDPTQEVDETGVLSLSEEEIRQLLEELTEDQPSEREIADALFRERSGVSATDWKKVEEFIENVNASRVPQEAQIEETADLLQNFRDRITATKGTLKREWQKLFCLIADKRKITKRAFRGPVRQSEGQRLGDPVAAYIDIMADETDPSGFEIDAKRTEHIIDVRAFEEDAIIDLTSSMEDTDEHGNVMRVEQKKTILSLLYHLMKLNEELNDSRIRSQLRTPLQIRSEVYSIHGSGRKDRGHFAKLKGSDENITEAALVHLARELDTTTPGSGDLVSALRAYKNGIDGETQEKIRSGELVKMLTIHSDGNTWCSACGCESCNVEMHRESIAQAQKEVADLRQLGVIVQGIGYTENGRSIQLICSDKSDPEAAVVVQDTTRAIAARHSMLSKHLRKV
tara:strand:+ start:3465 stop:6374 length:2910 start_codon:yes stop_codon:yes gene_type:complete